SYAPVIRDVVFVGNEADGWGAALHMREVWDVMEVTDCVFEGNTTINYGTLSCEGGTMLVTDCQFFGNDAECGGAIATRSTPGASHVTFTRCLISNNTALEAGAGAYVSGVGEATFIDCTFWENHLTYGWGGGVCVQEGPALLDGCTLHGNSADYGGGVGTVGPSTVTITNSIIAWGHGGGVVTCWEGSNVMITHSCVYGNFGSDSLCGDYHDNIRANPRFCEETGPDLTLHGESPCLPEGNPWGELIGAHGQGCGWPSPVEGSFYAVALGSESVRLRWAVEPVAGVESLIITRALSPEGPFVAVSDEPLQFVLSGNYLDSTVWPETTFWYELRVVFTDGIEEVLEPSPVQTTTEGHLLATLHPVSPNPFRDATSIQFDVAERAAHLVLAVYNVRGQLVRGLVDGPVPRGRHHAVWDGRDVSGAAVSSGVYFVRLESDREVLSQKLLFVK
ncbi:right-handed parallel beta-helix repeat-containing protein, partial [bacterium]|nr:right-handed parallel beta-helix repeat-containing protein [bacterium]